MPQRYTVELLSAAEYDRVVASDARYRNAADSLGFADPVQGKAWARRTVWPELNKFLVQHEFEHLLSPENGADRDEQGIYHKKFFKQVYLPVAAALTSLAAPALGGALGLGALGTTALTTGLGAGAGALAGKAGGGSAGRGALIGGLTAGVGRALTGGLGAFGMGTAASRPTSLAGLSTRTGLTGVPTAASGMSGDVASRLGGGLNAFGSLTKSPLLSSPLAQTNPIAAAAQQATGAPPGANPLSRFSLGLGGGGGGGGNPGPVGGAPQQKNFFERFLGGAGKLAKTSLGGGGGSGLGGLAPTLGQVALGGAISGIPYTGVGPQVPEVPEFGQLPGIQAFGADVRAKLGPLSERAGNLANVPLPEDVERRIRRNYDDFRDQVTSQFKAFRPGADLATDSAYRKALGDIDAQESEALTQAQFEFQGQERQNILAQFGIDTQMLNYFGQLAQLDIDTIMARLGLSAQEAQQFREVFGHLGAAVGGGGLGLFGGR